MSAVEPEILPCGDCALNVHFEEAIRPDVNARVCALAKALEAHRPDGVVEWVCAYCTLTVYYRPELVTFTQLSSLLRAIMPAGETAEARERTIVELPTVYGGEYGPDLLHVAEHAGLTAEEAVKRHSAPAYLVYMMGSPIWAGWTSGCTRRGSALRGSEFPPVPWALPAARPARIPSIRPAAGS